MAFDVIWHEPRRSGVRICEFQHNGERVEMSAAPCVQRTWKGDAGSVDWLKDRDTWAQIHAQTIADRMDFAVSDEGIKAAARAEYDQLQGEIDMASERRAELKAEHDLDPGVREVG